MINWYTFISEVLTYSAQKVKELGEQQEPKVEPPKPVLNCKTELEIGCFSVRTKRALSTRGINYVEDLVEMSKRDLINIGLGDVSIDEIQEYINHRDLVWKGEVNVQNSQG